MAIIGHLSPMPTTIDYSIVLPSLQATGLRCVYPNSGAFGPAEGAENHIVGWLSAEDETIRPDLRANLIVVPPPACRSLATLLTRAWCDRVPGPIWLMPASHWAFELQFGGDWIPPLLANHGIDVLSLQSRPDGSAIEFQPDESDDFTLLIESLLEHLTASDFTIAFPGRAIAVMLHHHRQIWWQLSDPALARQLGQPD